MESVDDGETSAVDFEVVQASQAAPGSQPAATSDPIDLDGIARDLADVEFALARLDAGTYWQCEETGQALSDELMESNPVARRLPTS
ncbi:MAG: hypothetical protein ABIR32_16975 [Ilumatobacteraceae bacterium]